MDHSKISIQLLLLLVSSISVVSCDPLLYSQQQVADFGRRQVSLNSPDTSWLLRRSDGGVTVSATVPGDVYSDLQRAGVIGDPVAEFNDVRTRWIIGYNWTYEAEFFVNDSLLMSTSAIEMVFEGVDTVGEVWLNGVPVLRCDSYWRVYRVNVTPVLRLGRNCISVSLMSPVSYAKQAAMTYAAQQGYKVPPDCPPDAFNGECHFNFVRKPAYSFSWDWGPAVPTSGIWRSVYLDIYPGLAIDYVKFSAYPRLDSAASADEAAIWRATVTAGIKFSGDPLGKQACLIAQIDDAAGLQPLKRCFDLPAKLVPGADNFTADVTFDAISSPKLWWPINYGPQPLYNLHVTLCSDGPDCCLNSSETRQVAFRTVRLEQAPVGTRLADGLSFRFLVNGRPVFVKGANFVPLSMAVATAGAGADYAWLMTSAAAAGVNMLRVWGGGTIERPEFYDMADQLGIMVWQDFPFACALYPTDRGFLATVRSEVRATVRRLQHRAPVAIWVANNENEGALANRWWDLGTNRSRYYSDYRRLYMRTVRPETLAEDATRPVLLSSPTNGDASDWEGGVAEHPQSTRFGDVHFYSYTGDMWLTESIPLTRFMSEFGFQSHPSLVTVLSATRDPRNVGVDTNFTLHREHQPNGTYIIERHNTRHFAMEVPTWLAGVNDDAIRRLLANYSVPPSELKQLTDQLASYAYRSYVSQVDQAEVYRRVTHLHAVHRCRLTTDTEGLSSGVMYWQLNDVWSAPTWSTIENTGAWKAAHHYARRYYANRRVAILKVAENDRGVVSAVYIDDAGDGSAGPFPIGFYCQDVNSFARFQSWTVWVNRTLPNCPTELFSIREADLLLHCKCPTTSSCFLEAVILDNPPSNNGNQAPGTYAEQYFFDVPRNFKRVRKPHLALNVTYTGSGGVFTIELSTVTPLYAVHLQFLCPGLARAFLSDNGFHLSGRSRSLTLIVPPAWQGRSPEDVIACLTVHYL